MKQSTLCFCIKGDQVLLAMKKRGFGFGKWNGYGGKVHKNEHPKEAAIRELEEESGLVADEKNLQQVGLVRFYFDENPISECSVYIIHSWHNEPVETEEMRPQWYPLSRLPFQDMWAADALWIPLILQGEKIEADIDFNTDGSAVKKFSYISTKFD